MHGKERSIALALVVSFLALGGGSWRPAHACELDGLVLKTANPLDIGTVSPGTSFSKQITVCREDDDPDVCSYIAEDISSATWISSVAPSSFLLGPGACETVTVIGDTPNAPTYSAQIEIQNDDDPPTGTTEIVTVAGKKPPICESDVLSTDPGSIDLGMNSPGTKFSKTITVCRTDEGSVVCHYEAAQYIPVSWVTSVLPTDFSLLAGDCTTVTVSGATPSDSSYDVSIEIKNVDQPTTFTADYVFISGTRSVTTGIFDYVTAHGPATATPGTTPTYTAGFSSSGARVTEWDWTFALPRQGGFFIVQQAVQKPIPPNKSSAFPVAIPLVLPAFFAWQRDANLDVSGVATVVARDEDGVSHTSNVYVGLEYPPGKPGLSARSTTDDSVTLIFSASGASSFNVYYSKDPHGPFTGVDALEGPSPLTVTGHSITLHFPGPRATRYFLVKAFGHGASDYSNEVIVTLPPILAPTLSPLGLALLGGLLLLSGVGILRRGGRVTTNRQT